MKKFYSLFSALVLAVAAFSQAGEISGKVRDENGEGAIGAVVVLVDKSGNIKGSGAQVDFDGNYSIKPLDAGKYNLKFQLMGYATVIKEDIVVYSGKATFLDVKMKPSDQMLNEVIVEAYKVPLIDPAKTTGGATVTKDDIAKLGTRNITDVAATASGVFQSDAGKGLNIGGAREDATEYYIDGVKVIGTPVIPQNAVQELSVLAGGIPARFGDATGGIVNITTSGPADKISGGVEFLTSQYLDKFGYNLANVTVNGPIVKSKKDKKPILGFSLAFEYLQQKDRDPSAVGVWKVRPEKLDSMRQYPLIKNPGETGFNLAGENLTMKDMYKVAAKPNNDEVNYRAVGRIDIKPYKNLNLSVGGTYTFKRYHEWVDRYTLLNYENNPRRTENNWRVYGRISQLFTPGQTNAENASAKKGSKVVQSVGYTLQFDYEKNIKYFEDESHGSNPFNYGYIGKFETFRGPVFRETADTFQVVDGGNVKTFSNMIVQQDFKDTSLVFTPGTLNPYGSRYTEQFFELGGKAVSLSEIQSNKALINGQRADLAYNVWYNTGRQYNGYGYDNYDEQYRGRAEVTLDLLKPGSGDRNKHTLEMGVEVEQRVQRRYQFSPLEIWFLSRQLMNKHIAGLDFSTPYFVLNNYPGKTFTYQEMKDLGITPGDLDTVIFKQSYKDSLQTNFDKNVRAKLGVGKDKYVNIDGLDPSFFDVSMFSAEELLNDNNSYVFYRGFDPYGKVLTERPKFFDFFTKTDANGNPLRQIDAFRPFYAAGYISDKFYFRDLTFNVGLRVDRYDANQYVLKDEYSLYEIKTVGETKGEFTHPSNIASDAYVYLKNSDKPSDGIAGYREGRKWYDAYGNELATGATVAANSSSGAITPYLEQLGKLKDDAGNTIDINGLKTIIKDTKRFDPSGSFEKYKAKYIVMPRLQFSFNIAENALFFAHYDVLSQRPRGNRNILQPTDYLYFNDNTGSAINNPNLKPERTIDFELGFKQKLTNFAALTISAYYREFRDQVQIKYFNFAFPQSYLTFDNIDFGTVKGFKLDLDLRRIKNFRASANYTMQFAEGTGSDDATQRSLATGGYDNLRTISPLSFDARHMINVILDYSFASGRDYDGPVSKSGYQILANTGVNFNIRARSGTPFTSQSNVTPEGLLSTPKRLSQGSINGSRLPWTFRVDFKIFKGFDVTVNKSKDKELQRNLNFQIYLQIQNLLNTANVVNVYRYTGNANDDGYLSSTVSDGAKNAAYNAQSYNDLYRAFINQPDYYSLPRRIFLGLQFGF
ncbi:MAG: carboxypeptidase regulatory-like domain-containing protein [Chitinophagales bacterium]